MDSTTVRQSVETPLRVASRYCLPLTSRAKRLPQIYSQYVASNSSSVSQVENALRSLAYLLPGARLRDTELASESLHTFIQLLSIYHDHLLKSRSSLTPQNPGIAHSPSSNPSARLSLHARYTLYWTNASSLYSQIATLLRITQYTELLWEMLGKRRGGEEGRWRVIVVLEVFKTLCKVVLLHLTHLRPLVTPLTPLRDDVASVEPQNDADGELPEVDVESAILRDTFNPKVAFGDAGVPTPPLSESEKPATHTVNFFDHFKMPRTGSKMSKIPSPDAITSYLLEHVVTPDDVKPAKHLLGRLTSLSGQAAEVLYILRPLIYAIMMQRVARQYGYEGSKWKKSWAPWLAGVMIEYASRQMASRESSLRTNGSEKPSMSALENAELKKRGWNMAWWGMRGAFYENITRNWVQGAANSLKGKPLVDLVGGVIEDYDHLWQYHFTSWNQ